MTADYRHDDGGRLERADFRLRSCGRWYGIAQNVGTGWELLSDRYETRAEAVQVINGWLRAETISRHPAGKAVGR